VYVLHSAGAHLRCTTTQREQQSVMQSACALRHASRTAGGMVNGSAMKQGTGCELPAPLNTDSLPSVLYNTLQNSKDSTVKCSIVRYRQYSTHSRWDRAGEHTGGQGGESRGLRPGL